MSKINLKFEKVAVVAFVIIGLAACGGPRIQLDPESREFYEYARLIMTEDEKDIFTHLPDREERALFIEDFWDKRDPDPDTEGNEYREEFYRRIDYANERFKQGPPGWKTDRGRIYIYFGSPDKIDEWFPQQTEEQALAGLSTQARIRGVLRWTYYRYGIAIDFYDRRGDNTYVIDNPLAQIWGDYFEALEYAKMGLDFANKERLKEYSFLNLELKYDRAGGQFTVIVPVKNLTFIEEDGQLKADFVFTVMIYLQKGGKVDEFQEMKAFSVSEDELIELENLRFAFPYDLQPGKYYVDVTVDVKPDVGKTRQIFKIRR
jgi:GWxTD domain-containing protein